MSKVYLLSSTTTKVSSEGTSTDVAKYITINEEEWKLPTKSTGEYLQLTGGTMAGSIIVGGNNYSNGCILSADDKYTFGAWVAPYSTSCTGFRLYGQYANTKGTFELSTSPVSGSITYLTGGTDGTLTWPYTGNYVLTSSTTKASCSGSSTDVINYITINDDEYKFKLPVPKYRHDVSLKISIECDDEYSNAYMYYDICCSIINNDSTNYTASTTDIYNDYDKVMRVIDAVENAGFTNSTYLPCTGYYYADNKSLPVFVDEFPTASVSIIGISSTYWNIGFISADNSSDYSSLTSRSPSRWVGIQLISYCAKTKSMVVVDRVTQLC